MKNKGTVILLCSLALFSCSKIQEKSEDQLMVPETNPLTKVILPSERYDNSSFLVKFSSVPTEEELKSLVSGGIREITPVFNSRKEKKDLESRFGLDRWYEVVLSENNNLDKTIMSFASLNTVEKTEYNGFYEKSAEEGYYPASLPETKAGAGSLFNDPMLSDQWHYINNGSMDISPNAVKGADINVKDVWMQLTCGDPSIIVAVIDEAVKYTHPDLKDNMWVNSGEIPGNNIDDDNNGYIDDVYGFNFVTNGSLSWGLTGDTGHGTHCAGTVAAVNNNGRGVAGVAGGSGNKDGCKIMSCQIFSGESGASIRGVSSAIKYAADNGASVISCSFGSTQPFGSDDAYINAGGGAEIDAIHYFEASKNNDVLDGNIAIFAASNDAKNYAYYPGAFHDIISVSALGPDGLPAYYTNYGPGCNIAAPGGEAYHVINKFKSLVLSTVPSEIPSTQATNVNVTKQDYGYMQGTSMACPHVSGVVALALSYAHQTGKKFNRDDFKQMILASTYDIDQKIGSVSSKSYAYGHAALSMAPYYHQMGSGAIDAWRLMMHIEGTPTHTAQIGRKQWIDLSDSFGTSSVSLTYLDVQVSQETIESLGLQKISGTSDSKFPPMPQGECYAFIQFGRLYIHPTKIGSGKITITAIGGGDHVGGGSNPTGGMEISQTVSLIAREADGGNGIGGWL